MNFFIAEEKTAEGDTLQRGELASKKEILNGVVGIQSFVFYFTDR